MDDNQIAREKGRGRKII